MLRAMLLPSGNDVAHSLAIDVGGSVAALRRADERLGRRSCSLGRTHFTTPVGLDTPPGNHSTAFDLARLANVLLRDPLVAAIVDERSRAPRRRAGRPQPQRPAGPLPAGSSA